MKDMVIKGTGNSRYLKSSISGDVTYSAFLEMLRAGTLPIDLNGLNEAGIEQQGTPLNTATLLKNSTAESLGLDTDNDPTVDDALNGLLNEISARTTVATGTYAGTGTYGEDNPNVLNFEFVPKMVIVFGDNVGWLMPQSGYWSYGFLWTTGMPYALTRNGSNASGQGVQFTQEGNSLSWYIKGASTTAAYQLNASEKTYNYFAIG